MSEIKYLSMKELAESGLLQEVNRLFFHPRGLALSVVVDDNSDDYEFGGIFDYRDDPVGCSFGSLDPETCHKKASYVYMLQEGKKEAREAELGYLIQPLPNDETIT